jgi:gluconolactonase
MFNCHGFQLNLSDNVQMVNGGTGPYKGDLLFVTSGRALLPPSIVRVNPSPPYNDTVILDNFLGRQFNSLNDIKILPGTDIMFFTDPA